MIRITADLDNTLLSVANVRTRAILNWLYHHKGFIFDKKQVKKSSSGKGCHVILWSNQYIPKDEIIFIRCLLGDDFKRLRLDLARKKGTQYLFNKKKYLK